MSAALNAVDIFRPTDPAGLIQSLRQRLNEVLRGKPQVVEFVITGVLARGHILIEDLPGLGKTTLAKALAQAIGGRFSRVQCTPDLMPGDITGFSIFNQKTREFDFQLGPVFADVLLADEINRATPRTQSALLEAMAERQVTVDGRQHSLSSSFFVIATQNPHDHGGTFPLPDAQLDRFALKLQVGYPNEDHEVAMLAAACQPQSNRVDSSALLTLEQLQMLQSEVEKIHVADNIRHYLVALAHATRRHSRIALGVSPRGLLIWQRVAQAWAYLHRRDYVLPEDVQDVAPPLLSVRLCADHRELPGILADVVKSVPIPVT